MTLPRRSDTLSGPVHTLRTSHGRGLVAVGLRLATATLVVWSSSCVTKTSAVLDLDGAPIDPLARETAQVTVLLFTRSDCPISNRYAPEVHRIVERFAPEGVAFWLVYADPEEAPQAIRQHLLNFGYSLPVARDMKHELVRLTGARVTPEAAVFNPAGTMVYRGRIDNRYEDFSVKRNRPSRHDLTDALMSVLARQDPATPRTKAVGCYIADLR